MNEYDFYFSLKSEEGNIYWGGFASAPDYENLKRNYQDVIVNKVKKILIIRYNNNNVGYMTFKIYDTTILDDFSIAVSDEFGGRSIASLAMQKLEEYLKKEHSDCKTFYSYIRLDNVVSQKVHKNNGFVFTCEYKDKFLESDNKVIRLQKWVKSL